MSNLLWVCPTCRAHLHPLPEHLGHTLPCPKCQAPVPLPNRVVRLPEPKTINQQSSIVNQQSFATRHPLATGILAFTAINILTFLFVTAPPLVFAVWLLSLFLKGC